MSEAEAEAQGIAYRLFKVTDGSNLRARTLSETRGFMKALVEVESDRILGFTAFGVGAGEIMAAVQIAMIAGLPYTALRDAVLTHPTLAEGLISLFASQPSERSADANVERSQKQESKDKIAPASGRLALADGQDPSCRVHTLISDCRCGVRRTSQERRSTLRAKSAAG